MENETPKALETTPVETTPVLSLDHRLKLLLLQRDALSAKVVFDSAQRIYQDKIRLVSETATAIGRELNLDLTKWSIDMDEVTLVPVQK